MEKLQIINSIINAINEANTPDECRMIPSDITAEQLSSYIKLYNQKFVCGLTEENMKWLYDFANNLPYGVLYFIKHIMDLEQ